MPHAVNFCPSLDRNTCFLTASSPESHYAKHSAQTRGTGNALEMKDLTTCPNPTVLLYSLEFFKEIEPIKGVCVERELYFMELAHAIVGTNKPETHKKDQWVRNSGRISILQS